jgi:hypothetical protein
MSHKACELGQAAGRDDCRQPTGPAEDCSYCASVALSSDEPRAYSDPPFGGRPKDIQGDPLPEAVRPR